MLCTDIVAIYGNIHETHVAPPQTIRISIFGFGKKRLEEVMKNEPGMIKHHIFTWSVGSHYSSCIQRAKKKTVASSVLDNGLKIAEAHGSLESPHISS